MTKKQIAELNEAHDEAASLLNTIIANSDAVSAIRKVDASLADDLKRAHKRWKAATEAFLEAQKQQKRDRRREIVSPLVYFTDVGGEHALLQCGNFIRIADLFDEENCGAMSELECATSTIDALAAVMRSAMEQKYVFPISRSVLLDLIQGVAR